jgi:hypothetical protein
MFSPDLGSEFFPSRIPDPNLFHLELGSRICLKEFKYLNPKNAWFLSIQKYDQGFSSWIRILIFLPIPDPGSRGQKGTGSRIRISNTDHVGH